MQILFINILMDGASLDPRRVVGAVGLGAELEICRPTKSESRRRPRRSRRHAETTAQKGCTHHQPETHLPCPLLRLYHRDRDSVHLYVCALGRPYVEARTNYGAFSPPFP